LVIWGTINYKIKAPGNKIIKRPVISDYADVGNWAVIAEGAVVRNKARIPDRCITTGTPAKVIGNINEEYMKTWTEFKEIYEELATTRYPSGLKRIAQQ